MSSVAISPGALLNKRAITDLGPHELSGKRVFVRCDLNVPLDGDLITDDTRIRASVSTIQYLTNNGAKVLVATHLGRPKNGPDPKYSVAKIRHRLEEVLGRPVLLCQDCIGTEVAKKVAQMETGDVLLLENVRFHPQETENDPSFSRALAANADLYVNDAFGAAHRAHASTEGIARLLRPSVAGILMKKELDYLNDAVSNPKRPFSAIVGGSKVSSKIGVLESLLDKVDSLIIGGGMAFTFLKARGMNVGSSIVEEDKIEMARRLENLAKEAGVKIILPIDVVAADRFAPDAADMIVPVDSIPDGWWGLDNGPETTRLIKDAISDSKTILWNGPMGVFEFEKFSRGTIELAKCVADMTARGALTIIGGGDSVAAVEKAGVADKMSHISTGGGAALELLEGKILPGVAALDSS